jgi:hypothetical protein
LDSVKNTGLDKFVQRFLVQLEKSATVQNNHQIKQEKLGRQQFLNNFGPTGRDFDHSDEVNSESTNELQMHRYPRSPRHTSDLELDGISETSSHPVED